MNLMKDIYERVKYIRKEQPEMKVNCSKLGRQFNCDRLIKNVVRGLSSRKNAKEEGVNYSTVDKSIKAAKKNFRCIFEKLQ